MISFLFIALAAFFNAVMDVVETTISYKVSVFKNRDINFWCKPISAHNIDFLPFSKFRPDAWHLSKSLMIIFLVLAVVCYRSFFGSLCDFLFLGILWNVAFNIFYNKVLK